jgi:hypothetical protein
MSGSWQISEVNSAVLVTGTQDFNQNSLSIPVSFNYSFYKKGDLDIYLGLKAGLMFNSLNTEEGYVDYTNLRSHETILSQMPILDVKKSLFVPGIKLGSNFPVGQNRRLYAELQADYASNMYLTSLPNFADISYNATAVSLNIGFEF